MKVNEYVKYKENQLLSVSQLRDFPEKIERRYNYRTDADIDYARIIYSSAFRRLQGKMQLFVPDSINFYRNRLTHSMEVAQIAKSIAGKLSLKDRVTVCACSLAHDIGNPPFGHAGEIVLNSLSKKVNYEGNAQTFRVLDHLEEKHWDHNGLNLTWRTLLGIVKYPFQAIENPKKFLYDNDYYRVSQLVSAFKISLKTIDCEIMDISDEIAYAAHDLEDALRLKYFSIDDIIYEFESTHFKDALPGFKKMILKAKSFASKSTTYGSSEEYSILFKKELTSLIVDQLIKDVGLNTDKTGQDKLGFKTLEKLATGLKVLTFNAVKRNPDIYRYELLGKKVLEGLFEVLTDKKYNKDQKLLPAEYRDFKRLERTVIDYLGGMMDNYAINQYNLYFGENSLKNIQKQSWS